MGSDINAAERWATSERFHLNAGYPHSKTIPRLSPSRLRKAFDPVNIITGESLGAGRQRDSTMRGKCRDTHESGRYKEHSGAKIMLMLSEQLPTLTRRWRLHSLPVHCTWRLWGVDQTGVACHLNVNQWPFLLGGSIQSSMGCSVDYIQCI